MEVTIPKLNEMAYEQVELEGVPFTDFVNNKDANGQPAQQLAGAARLRPHLDEPDLRRV